MTLKKCSYKKCRNDASNSEEYCKYHKRLHEIEMQGPTWLNEMIEEMKNEIEEKESITVKAKCDGGEIDALETKEHL